MRSWGAESDVLELKADVSVQVSVIRQGARLGLFEAGELGPELDSLRI